MPTPKKKSSRMRRGHRRSHDALKRPSVNNCSNCSALKMPHNICMSCGHYDGREVVAANA